MLNVIRCQGMQIKTTVRSLYTATRLAMMKQTTSSVGKDGTAGVLLMAGGDRNQRHSGKLAGSATAQMQQLLCWVNTLRKHTECPQPQYSLQLLTGNSPNLHPHLDRSINYDLSLRRSNKEQRSKMNYCYTQQSGWLCNTRSWAQEVKRKWNRIIWFPLHTISPRVGRSHW